MGNFTKREQIVILVIVLIIISSLVFKVFLKDILMNKEESLNIIRTNNQENDILVEEENLEEEKIIMVHISGQVYKPGIVEIELGKRLIDGVNLAGGLKKEADLDRINLAKKLVDEEKIYIPKIGEEIEEIYIETISSSGSKELININKCSLEELMSLPGIGEVLAMRIIDYRKTNPFEKIEELKNVSGIGDKKYDGLRDMIKVK